MIFFPEQLEQEFPFWRHLHGFWHALPNFNPYMASSEPRQDLAGDTLALIHGRRHDNNHGYKEEEEDFYTNAPRTVSMRAWIVNNRAISRHVANLTPASCILTLMAS